MRSLLKDNLKNQEIIRHLEAREAVQTDVLKDLDLKPTLKDGKVVFS
jgi:hypothetical protein